MDKITNTTMRTFASGASRHSDVGKLDYEGFLSPIVLRRYAEYLNKHRVQADGKLRDSDNWQKGISKDVYMKSMWRHFMDVWTLHRGFPCKETSDISEALCAVLFNVMGMLFEIERAKDKSESTLTTLHKQFLRGRD